jgi:hypothetical protein
VILGTSSEPPLGAEFARSPAGLYSHTTPTPMARLGEGFAKTVFSRKHFSNGNRVSKVIASLAAILALAAVASSNAVANQFEASPTAWYIGASPGTKLVGSESVNMAAANGFSIETSMLSKSITFKGTGIECIGCVIENPALGSSALVKGKLRFTGVVLGGLESCSATSVIQSKPMVATVGGPLEGKQVQLRWQPAEGEGWATEEITGEKCSLAGLYKLTGAIYGEFVLPKGTAAKSQPIKFSRALQGELGAAFHFGQEPAYLNAEASLLAAREIAVKEK